MNTSMPNDPQFNKYYHKHQKCLKLAGLQPKTVEAYARAIRRIGFPLRSRAEHRSHRRKLGLWLSERSEFHRPRRW